MKPAEAFGDCLSILVVKLRFGLENGKEKAMKKLTSMTAKKRLFESGKEEEEGTFQWVYRFGSVRHCWHCESIFHFESENRGKWNWMSSRNIWGFFWMKQEKEMNVVKPSKKSLSIWLYARSCPKPMKDKCVNYCSYVSHTIFCGMFSLVEEVLALRFQFKE